jgi:hypothetical protein
MGAFNKMPIITLPLPPSLNALWRSNRGRVHKSYRYAAWIKGAELKLQRPGRVASAVNVTVAVGWACWHGPRERRARTTNDESDRGSRSRLRGYAVREADRIGAPHEGLAAVGRQLNVRPPDHFPNGNVSALAYTEE